MNHICRRCGLSPFQARTREFMRVQAMRGRVEPLCRRSRIYFCVVRPSPTGLRNIRIPIEIAGGTSRSSQTSGGQRQRVSCMMVRVFKAAGVPVLSLVVVFRKLAATSYEPLGNLAQCFVYNRAHYEKMIHQPLPYQTIRIISWTT